MKDFNVPIQSLIDHIKTATDVDPWAKEMAEELLKELEAKHGEWIDIWREDDPDTSSHARCSVCNRISTRPVGAYCKWCGAKMDDEVEGR